MKTERDLAVFAFFSQVLTAFGRNQHQSGCFGGQKAA
jgi:hypothetical protein